MQAIRQLYENAPSAILVPEPMQHRRLRVSWEIQEPDRIEPKVRQPDL